MVARRSSGTRAGRARGEVAPAITAPPDSAAQIGRARLGSPPKRRFRPACRALSIAGAGGSVMIKRPNWDQHDWRAPQERRQRGDSSGLPAVKTLRDAEQLVM